MSTATAKAIDSAKKMGKPSEANAKVIAQLFPGYKGTGVKRKFDPNDDCVVAEQHRQKKAALKGKVKGRAKSINVMIVEGNGNSIPRGVKKEQLKNNGKFKTLDFFRYMTSKEVNEKLGEAFPGKKFAFLKPSGSNTLNKADNQSLDGNEIFDLAKSGSLYLRTVVDTGKSSEECFDSSSSESVDLPTGPVHSSKQYTQEEISTLLKESREIVQKLRVCL